MEAALSLLHDPTLGLQLVGTTGLKLEERVPANCESDIRKIYFLPLEQEAGKIFCKKEQTSAQEEAERAKIQAFFVSQLQIPLLEAKGFPVVGTHDVPQT
jgi:hypothetical protein